MYITYLYADFEKAQTVRSEVKLRADIQRRLSSPRKVRQIEKIERVYKPVIEAR